MKEELGYIGKRVITNKETLASKTVKMEVNGLSERIAEPSLSKEELSLESRAEIIAYLGEALFSDQDEVYQKINGWTRRISEESINKAIPLDKLIKTISMFRLVIWESFSEELSQKKFAAITMLDVSLIIDPIMDEVMFTISQCYAKDNEQKIKSAQKTLQQLSVPVVPLAEDVAVLPLIGEIDTYRAKLIIETSLVQSTTLGIEYLIIDVSGVPIVDTSVAHSLFEVVNALKLIGVDTTITGIRPEIAQTVVSLGLEFKGIKTMANLHHALANIGFVRK